MAQSSQKSNKQRTDGDTAAIRQRKKYRKMVMAKMAMVAGTEVRTTYNEVIVQPQHRGQAKKVAPQARIVAQHKTTERPCNNPSNRNARIRGLTVGDCWKLAAVLR